MAIHPLFHVALKNPELIAEHLANHLAHAKAQGVAAVKSFGRKLAGVTVAVVALLIALNLTGVAFMLAAIHGHWLPALIWVPALAWITAIVGALVAWRESSRSAVEELTEEFSADASMLALIKEART